MSLNHMAQNAQHELLIVSPYFVPGAEGAEALKALVAKGVNVRVLTNSLASTDVVAVHSGYRHYREALVEGGVDLLRDAAGVWLASRVRTAFQAHRPTACTLKTTWPTGATLSSVPSISIRAR